MSLPLLFALAMPVDAPAGAPVFVVELPPAAYATLATSDRRDIAVIDADGRPQTIAWIPAPAGAEADDTLVPLPPPLVLPTAGGRAGAPPDGLALRIEHDPNGHLRALTLASDPRATAGGGSAGIVVDAGPAARLGYDGLRIRPLDRGNLRVTVDVLGSNDLAVWTPLADDAPLLRVADGRQTVQRLDVRFGTARYRYLWITAAGQNGAVPPLDGVDAIRASPHQQPALRTFRLAPIQSDADGRGFTYPAPGPLPLRAVSVRENRPNATLAFTLRQASDRGDLVVASGTSWQFDVEGRPLQSAPLVASNLGLGPLRLETVMPADAPVLELHVASERLAIVAGGRPPYRLLAGSARHRTPMLPLDDALAGLSEAAGLDTPLPMGRVGPAVPAGGASALQPDRGTLALWGVLGLGALIIGAAAWRLLRGPSPPG